MQNQTNYLSFQNLEVYKLTLTVNRRIASSPWPTGRSHLKDQAIRAADSMVLNLAEGMGRGRHTRAGKNHFRIARGSAGEVFAVVDLLHMDAQLKTDLQRIQAMLTGLAR